MTDQLQQSLGEFNTHFNRTISQYFDIKIEREKSQELKGVWLNLKEYILAGGKRLRPYIFHRMNVEFRKEEGIENILLAFEFLHNSTLIDDDIIDEHCTRRNRPTLPSVYSRRKYKGDFAALLHANILRNAGLDLIVSSGTTRDFERACVLAYQDIATSIDSAQVLDLEYRERFDVSEQEYIAQIDLVAARFIAYMFSLCAPEQYKKEFFEVGRNIGIAFQLADDLIDIDETKQKGRALGSDIREGTPTLLSIYAFEKVDTSTRERFQELYSKKDISQEELGWIISQYEKTGAIHDTQQKIKEYVTKANDILFEIRLSDNHWIRTFGRYSLERTH